MKKVLALVLALMMAVSLMVTANAAVVFGDADKIDSKYQEAVDVLAQLGIIEGIPSEESESDGADKINTFDPKGAFDRASFAKILFILYTGADPKDERFAKYANYDSFDDIPDGYKSWALVPINYLNEIGVMIGTGNRKFEPTRVVTGYEAVRGLLQAIGRGKLGEFDKPWNEATLDIAVEGEKRHITTGLDITSHLSKDLTREEVAGLVFNTLTNEEAHRVTYAEATGTYIEEENGYNRDKWVTLGEVNWELHQYGKNSGKTYPSDKEINVDLDEFGRPTNPKWVAMVKGEPVTIGTENKALLTYYKDAVTRKQLAADFYREFAFKDNYANTEFYVDGEWWDDPWNYAYDSRGNRASDYDTIGGKGVTVEVYLMQDHYVAISEDDLYAGRGGDTVVNSAGAWPRMRVVIVHHYAAEITDQMLIPANAVSKAPAHLNLPYDKWVGWTDDTCTTPLYREWNVTLPLDQADDEYEVGDAIYFDVAISEEADGTPKYTVYNDINLTDEGLLIDDPDGAPITYTDPNKDYVRLAAADEAYKGVALYYNYFMKNTTTDIYSYRSVKVDSAAKQKVYLEPTGTFVTLIVSEPKPATPIDSDGYYYIEAAEIRLARTSNVWNEKDIQVVAKLVNVKTHEQKTEPLDYVLDASGKITSIAGFTLSGGGIDLTNAVTNANDYAGYVYVDLKNELITAENTTTGRYVWIEGEGTANEGSTVVLPDGRERKVREWYKLTDYTDYDDDGNIAEQRFDHDGHEIFFGFTTIDGAVRTVISRSAKTDANGRYKVFYEKPATGDAWYSRFAGIDPTKIDVDDALVVTTAVATKQVPLVHQFVRLTTSTKKETEDVYGSCFSYDMRAVNTSDCLAYDDDYSYTFEVYSNIFDLNDTSSRVYAMDGGYKLGFDTAIIKTPAEAYVTEDTQIISYKWNDATQTADYKGTYGYYEFIKFSSTDANRQVLVVTYPDVYGVEEVQYIVVIDSTATSFTANDSYYGIYCGYDQLPGTNKYVLYFVSPYSNEMTKFEGATGLPIDRNNIGHIYKVTPSATDPKKVAGMTEVAGPEYLVKRDANSIITYNPITGKTTPHTLRNTTYYYLAGNYVSQVTASFEIDPTTDRVGVYENKDGSTVVVIMPVDVLEGLKDGDPEYGDIDENWAGRK